MSLTSWAHSGLFTSDHKPHAIKEKGLRCRQNPGPPTR
jgi:hypothetical protein